ncbi:MAG: class I SAM-dependent methyltransferase [Patescibacteria group bacterium]|nr:class I SAM-dependent methyltransferase [Patescibacteria group bacterium]
MHVDLSASSHSAKDSQQKRLQERKTAAPVAVKVCDVDFVVERGVYDTSVDTELMAQTVRLGSDDTFLEVGCGSGAISLLLAKKCLRGVATDINPLAVENAIFNADRLGTENVSFVWGDGFAGVDEKFNVLLCNPPYNNLPTSDPIERMFWDPEDGLKKEFFHGAAAHLLPNGRVYFGWANFGDIDVGLPLKLAEQNGFVLMNKTQRPSRSGKYIFYVMEFAY